MSDWMRRKWERQAAERREREESQRVRREPNRDIYDLAPTPTTVMVSRHSIESYIDRVGPSLGDVVDIVGRAQEDLVRVICGGRRSDRDRELRSELSLWLCNVTWKHMGRPVVLFFEEATRIGVLATACQETPGSVVALTCFYAPVSKGMLP